MFRIQQLDHVALTVSDLRASIAWYQRVLGLEQRHEEVWHNMPAMLCAGDTCLALFASQIPQPASAPDDKRTLMMRHLAFRVDRVSFEQAQQRLTEQGIVFEFADHAISHSIYFADPDGYRLELTTYEV